MQTAKVVIVSAFIGSTTALGCNEDALRVPANKTSAVASSSADASAKPMQLPPMPVAAPLTAAPASLPEMKVPADNPLTAEKVHLGKQLFFDKRLSKDGSASCETCHVPEKGWTDANAFSTKVGGAVNTRHSPTLWNVGYNDAWYWDGRAATLEKQIEAAWKGQMGADPAKVASDVAKVPGYVVQFKSIFGADPTPDAIVKAIASFVRTIRTADAPWDKHEKGDKQAVAKDAARGWEVFRNKAGCAACHVPPLYTDNAFHNIGIGTDKPEPDPGRGKITSDPKDQSAFKTPTLRNVASHAPLFHDGRAVSLDDAVDVVLSGGVKNKNLDARIKPVKITKAERADLLAFIQSLAVQPQAFDRPTLP